MNFNNRFLDKLLNKGGKPMINGKRILVALCDGHGVDTAGKRTPTLPRDQKSEIGRPYMNENLFNRAVVGYVDEHLRHIGFDTLLVAPTDADTPLETRTALANARKADIYVSVHANALAGQWNTHGGIETFYYPSTESRKLSSAIHKQVLKGTEMKDRGLKNGSHLWVLRKTYMPATLLELGFMDSLLDYDELLKDSYRRESAREIVMGICDYFNVKFVEMPQQEKPKPAPKPQVPMTSHGKPVLQIGAKGTAVREMQMLLIRHKIQIVADGDFGEKTKAGVMQFQRNKNIQVDGSVGEQTWGELLKPVAKPAPKPTPKPEPKPEPVPAPKPVWRTSHGKLVLQKGANGEEVKEAQELLNKHGAKPKLSIDGDFGSLTYNAVIQFQGAKKLEVDGSIGEKTWAELLKPIPAPKPVEIPLKEHQYRAVKGDTLWSIGDRHDLTVDELKKQNPHITMLQVGDIVNVKPMPKPAPKPVVGKLNTSKSGDRVESLVDDLKFYETPTWDEKDSVGKVDKGFGFTIVGELDVDGYPQYKVKNSAGAVFYLTANNKYVKVIAKPQPKPEPKPEPKQDSDTGFRVVAGSFTDLKEANKRVAFLKGKGYQSFVSPFKDNGKMHYRVVVGSFDSRENAEKRGKELAQIGVSTFLLAIKK